ncbi:MAG: hypothetical protein RL112_1348 [Planctomycetota bacterium]
MKFAAPLALVLACAGCASGRAELEPIARARVASDYASYDLRRVGVVPFEGALAEREHGKALQAAFAAELAGGVDFEVVPLSFDDIEETARQDTLRRGRTDPQAILELARRYRLDGVVVGTVVELSSWPHARAGIEVDLLATETGMAIWSARVHADAARQSTRDHLERWLEETRKDHGESEGADVWLLSSRRLVEFAAAQAAALL